jgi:hypothetical protein
MYENAENRIRRKVMRAANSKDWLSGVWTDIITEPDWMYQELPPFLLPEVTELDLLEASDFELARVIWFWSRRPKLMFHRSSAPIIVALCVLISLCIALFNWPETSIVKRVAEVITIVCEVVVEIYMIGCRLKFVRWRREYERSIDRLIRTLHPGV